MTTSTTTQLANFIANVRTVPSAVEDRAKVHITDTLACIYSGTAAPAVQVLAETLSLSVTNQGAVLAPGWGEVREPYLAALLIGTCAHADDLDDTSQFSMWGHPSAPIVSALLPTASATRPSGREFIRAYAVGIEVACKLGSALSSAHKRQGWHTMGTFGTLGAAAAAANLRGLDAARTETAIAIACSFAGSLIGNTGSMTKGLHCGRAAHDGYLAAALAERGFTAGKDILEVKSGFKDAFTDGSIANIGPLNLGAEWEIITPGLAVKLYASCAGTHLAIDGAIQIRQNPEFDVSQVVQVDCYVRKEYLDYLRFPAPKAGIEGKFSMNYTVAVALLYGDVTFEDFETAAVLRDEVVALLPKIRMHLSDAASPDIEVALSNGTKLMARNGVQRGAPEDPVGWSEVEKKLASCVARAKVKPRSFERLVTRLRDLENQEELLNIFLA